MMPPAHPAITHSGQGGLRRTFVFQLHFCWLLVTHHLSWDTLTHVPVYLSPSISHRATSLVSAANWHCCHFASHFFLFISMINKCRPQHYWHLSDNYNKKNNNGTSFGQNMLRLFCPKSDSLEAVFAVLVNQALVTYTRTHARRHTLSALFMIQTYAAPLSQLGDNKYT